MMMKSRSSSSSNNAGLGGGVRALSDLQTMSSGRNKQLEPPSSSLNASSSSSVQSSSIRLNQNQSNNSQAANSQSIRKRRSSINVYDQPSSLNSRLRQLETDMLRLDEDRTKLYDDTHSALAQSEIRLNELHAILKSRQDNVEKYVDDMKLLLQAKEDFEKQAKLLNEKHDRIQEKFMHRETTISREIKLLKNKFELLEKNRQFRSILQKSNANTTSDNSELDSTNDHLLGSDFARSKSEVTSEGTIQSDSTQSNNNLNKKSIGGKRSKKNVRIKSLSKLGSLRQFVEPILNPLKFKKGKNKVSSMDMSTNQTRQSNVGLSLESDGLLKDQEPTTTNLADGSLSATNQSGESSNGVGADQDGDMVIDPKKKQRRGLFGIFR